MVAITMMVNEMDVINNSNVNDVNSDSTFVVKAEMVTTSDTVFYQINKSDLRLLYQQAFGDMIDEKSARDHLMLTFTYVPLVLIFTILISIVNIRWNKAYKRIKDKEAALDLSETDRQNIYKLDLQYYRVPGRILFYLVVWIVAAIFDTLIILNDILQVPWAAVVAAIFTMTRILLRLVDGSTLMGIDDSDLMKNYVKPIKSMLGESIANKIKRFINDK